MWAESRGEVEDRYPEMDEFPESQMSVFEKETIGFYISRHPLSRFQEAIRRHTSEDTSTLMKRKNGGEVKICGVVSDLKEIMTKKGDRMGFLTLEDMKGLVEVILFPGIQSFLPYLRGRDRSWFEDSGSMEDHVKISRRHSSPRNPVRQPWPSIESPRVAVTPSQLEEFREYRQQRADKVFSI
jgi:hypothetical protein